MEQFRCVILMFDGLTALDAVGPFEALLKIPGAKVIFASLQKGLISCNGGVQLVACHSLQEIDRNYSGHSRRRRHT